MFVLFLFLWLTHIAAERGTDLDGQLEEFYGMNPTLVNARGGREKLTPFHLVALHYAFRVGALLQDHGGSINSLDGLGRTPLDLLLQHGSPARIFNFDPSAENSESRFICDYALAGPVYWHKEHLLRSAMLEQFLAWGAKQSSASASATLPRTLASFVLE